MAAIWRKASLGKDKTCCFPESRSPKKNKEWFRRLGCNDATLQRMNRQFCGLFNFSLFIASKVRVMHELSTFMLLLFCIISQAYLGFTPQLATRKMQQKNKISACKHCDTVFYSLPTYSKPRYSLFRLNSNRTFPFFLIILWQLKSNVVLNQLR